VLSGGEAASKVVMQIGMQAGSFAYQIAMQFGMQSALGDHANAYLAISQGSDEQNSTKRIIL
jgi:hypothetical protein